VPFDDRGSLWRRWDLHFHTPTSFDYENGAVTNEQIVAGLKNAGVSVVAITDHHVIDVPRIRALQQLAGDDLTILPGIEFRTELGGKEKVHLIGIFPEDSNLDDLWTKLSGKLEITPEDIKKKTDQAIYVDFREAAALIRGLGGIVTTHAGGKSNSIENIGRTPFKMALKTDLACECVDVYEVGKLADCKGYQEIVFPAIGKTLPLIMGSDNHDITHYQVKTACWIKGDPSFRTFQQLISDPQRAFLGETPMETVRIDGNPTKYVSEIAFVKSAGSKLEEDWFSGTVKLNPGLVAIIGNKGSGKTALAEAIGLMGNCTSADAFSFLSEKKFRQPRNNKAKEFQATLTWHSQHTLTRSLSQSTDENAPPAVSYIPQSYLELICNEVNNQPGGAFDKELKSVIFSHVSEDKKLGNGSLDALLTFQTEPLQQRLEALRVELTELNRSILELLQRSSSTNRQMLLGLKDSKDRELEAHDQIKPEEVSKPETDPARLEEMNRVSEQITAVNQERDELNESVRVAAAAQRSDATKNACSERILQQIRNFEAAHATLLANLKADCEVIGLDPRALVSLTVKLKPVTDADAAATLNSEQQAGIIKNSNTRLDELKGEIERLTAELDAPNSAHQKYIEALRTWTERREALIGTAEKRDSLSYIERQIVELDGLPHKLKQAEEARALKVKDIFTQIQEIVQTYRKLYHPVQEFILLNQVANQKLHLEFDASIVPVNIDEAILSKVNQARRGSFAGVDEGRRALKAQVETADFQSAAGALAFAEAVVEHFRSDHRQSPPQPVELSEQLKAGSSPLELLDAIFGLKYLSPKYQLKWSGKSIEELSPGERGTLLLIFYLLIDRRDIPLIIDQPEDNLDNQTVYDMLVECLREARQRRQVIIVTHNPNMAVVCDADQIIYSHINKQHKNKVTYTSGSLENPKTNTLSITVLEGTRRAFLQRDRKYHDET
jgi:ABC-type lipoprotein export system ATPase subunit